MTDSNSAYNPQNIPRLTARDAVRQRPGMYIGGTDARALHHLVYEILDHMVEEAFVGRCDHIELTLLPENRVVMRDNSHGLPMSPYKDSGLTKMEAILVNLVAHKRDFEPELYAVTGGVHGMGLAAVNALSAEMVVENAHDGFLWRQVYREGLAQSSLEQIRPLDETEHGTTFSFVPDFTLLQPNSFDFDRLAHRCREVAYQLSGLSITLHDKRVDPPLEQTFFTTEGLKTLIQELNAGSQPLHDVVYLAKEVTMNLLSQSSFAVGIEFAFQFTDTTRSNILSYVNTVETTSGGTHLAAMKASILSALNEADLYPFDDEDDEAELTWKRIAPGLSAVISIRHPNPHFLSPTKAVLGNREIYGAVAGLVYNSFWEQLQGMGWEKRKALGRHFLHPYTSNSDDSVV